MIALGTLFSHTTTPSIEPTIEQLAHEAMQLQYITDDDSLTDTGRSLMEQIGNYAKRWPLLAEG